MLVKAVLWCSRVHCLTYQAEAETGGLPPPLPLQQQQHGQQAKRPSYRRNNICLEWLKITASFAEERTEHGLQKKVRGQSPS